MRQIKASHLNSMAKFSGFLELESLFLLLALIFGLTYMILLVNSGLNRLANEISQAYVSAKMRLAVLDYANGKDVSWLSKEGFTFEVNGKRIIGEEKKEIIEKLFKTKLGIVKVSWHGVLGQGA